MENSEDTNAPATQEAQPYALGMLIPRLDRSIRKGMPGKRVSAGVSVYAVAALDVLFSEIIQAAETKRASANKPKRAISRLDLVAGVRQHPQLTRVFRGYQFASNATSIKFKADKLLTKADRAAAARKREAATAQKKKKQAVPSVVEE